ncbi:MAG TPA: RHS repeat-associated core domain-containing protein [Terracidiphilus sp.]|jgi:RHS repeat-associated protein|nr:RHS repeat-associated core domain-containing protein [Terracidiphilus sp.]
MTTALLRHRRRESIFYNPAGGETTGLLAMISGAATTYYHQDHLSVRLTTNASGSILTQEGTFPFGEAWYQSGATNKWVFTSYQRDSESGLDYALARYYDSRTGTFCSADPLAGSPDDPQSWNRYPYGRNDPIDVTDPSGKGWASWLLDIGLGVTVALLPEIAPSLFATTETTVTAGSIWGSTGMTIVESGQSSSYFFMNMTVTSTTNALAGLGPGAAIAIQAVPAPQRPTTPTPQARFTDCNNKYGTPNAKSNLNYQGYQDAAQAAHNARLPLNQVLSLWDNENSLQENWALNGSGDLGPMQVTPPAAADLNRLHQLPGGWNTNYVANLEAGARYFRALLHHYHEPLSSAAAAYKAGPNGNLDSDAAQQYQNRFNWKSADFQRHVHCMH